MGPQHYKDIVVRVYLTERDAELVGARFSYRFPDSPSSFPEYGWLVVYRMML